MPMLQAGDIRNHPIISGRERATYIILKLVVDVNTLI